MIESWAIKWGIKQEALADLRYELTKTAATHNTEYTEADISVLVRLEASRKGARLWRNNVGATYTQDGKLLRYGLANTSSKVNAAIKSSDLIGIKPVHIGPQHVGSVIGQFIAREVKAPNWVYKGTKREQAQLKFIELVTGLGGDAKFVNKEGSI